MPHFRRCVPHLLGQIYLKDKKKNSQMQILFSYIDTAVPMLYGTLIYHAIRKHRKAISADNMRIDGYWDTATLRWPWCLALL